MGSKESAIQDAISEINSGSYKSERVVAKVYGVPRSTLRGRIRGDHSHTIAHSNQQRLSPEQEEYVVEWILEEDSRAQPPSHPRAREMVTRILQMNGDSRPLGKLWLSNFIKRNPRIKSVVGRSIESVRTTASSFDTIKGFLELFERTRTELGIHYEDIWNMDETGLALGVCSNTRVLASSQKKKAYLKTPEDREWVSIIETISATGQKLPCLVIFKGKSLQSTWFPAKGVPNWLYTTSENGWTSNQIGSEWLKRIFLPNTTPRQDQWRLLILDGHGSHTPVDFMLHCRQHKVYLLYLPPHTSHVLQPLDLAPFSVVKSRYRDQIHALSALDDATPVKKERFITSYNHARNEGLSARNIRAGWKASGLCPYNPQLVLNSSQVLGRPVTPPQRNQTLEVADQVVNTPHSARDLHFSQQLLRRSENIPRPTRMLGGKAGKAIDNANARAALHEAESDTQVPTR